MIQVHHLNNSRSHRILWMLEELGQPYEIVAYQRDTATMLAPPSLKAIHPLGKSPVIEDGDLVLAESGAILEYLAGKYGGGRFTPAAGTAEHIRYLHWMHFAEGSAMPLLVLKLYLTRAVQAPQPVLDRVNAQISTQLDYMEDAMARSTYFAGERFSAADVQMSFPVLASAARGGLNASRPRLWAWLDAMKQRPAFMAATARGGVLELP
ncbi:MAG: glutathione S-transferase family protein [Betaproteobacteria bacterium]|nr:glutathione S-transferase family protein [Betaproteobacteria bacterium]